MWRAARYDQLIVVLGTAEWKYTSAAHVEHALHERDLGLVLTVLSSRYSCSATVTGLQKAAI